MPSFPQIGQHFPRHCGQRHKCVFFFLSLLDNKVSVLVRCTHAVDKTCPLCCKHMFKKILLLFFVLLHVCMFGIFFNFCYIICHGGLLMWNNWISGMISHLLLCVRFPVNKVAKKVDHSLKWCKRGSSSALNYLRNSMSSSAGTFISLP